MRRIEDARKKYEEITVPDELSKRILTEIRKSDEQCCLGVADTGQQRRFWL